MMPDSSPWRIPLVFKEPTCLSSSVSRQVILSECTYFDHDTPVQGVVTLPHEVEVHLSAYV